MHTGLLRLGNSSIFPAHKTHLETLQIDNNFRCLVAVPIYNEGPNVIAILSKLRSFVTDILVIDDGSTDNTPLCLKDQPSLNVITHHKNRGYGAALISAFDFCIRPPSGLSPYDGLVTLDCDGQHEPERISKLIESLRIADIVSGSRYLCNFSTNSAAPEDRRRVNATITSELNHQLGTKLTDAFCGFKAYRKSALGKLRITETGWGMPLQVWVQAAKLGLRVVEVPIPRIYLDPNRTFGGTLTIEQERLTYYRRVINDALMDHSLDIPTGQSVMDIGIDPE